MPRTEGFHTELPPPHSSTVVWGNHPAVVATATTWLLQQGLVVIERAKLEQILAAQTQSAGSMGFRDDAMILNAAKGLGAKNVVFATQSGDVRAPMVSVRGVDTETTQIVWSGYARYPHYVKRPLSDLLVNLTCEALATAWGKEHAEREGKEAHCLPSENAK